MSVQNRTARLQRFEPNRAGRDYAVGDIHGCFGLLEALLTHIGFDRTADRLFSVGDLIDRGPDSEHVCEWLEQPWFYAIRGNHEAMLLDSVQRAGGKPGPASATELWFANGGDWFFNLERATQMAIGHAVAELPWAIEVALKGDATAALVHADVLDDSWPATRALLEANKPTSRISDQLAHLLWSRRRATAATQAMVRDHVDAVSVAGVDLICFGHTPMRWPLALGNTRWLDTGAVYGGSLTVTELAPNGSVWSKGDASPASVGGWKSRV